MTVDSRQSVFGNFFDLITDRRLTTDDIEILPVEPEVLPQVFRKLFDLRVVLGTDYGVDVQPEAIAVASLERIERLNAVKSFVPVARHAADSIVSCAVAIERDI